jgi:hypothetical protein
LSLGAIAPSVSLAAYGGWAWAEKTARGGARLRYDASPWTVSLLADRTLAMTDQFGVPLDSDDPGLAALLTSFDDYDYVDRDRAMLAATRAIGSIDEAFATVQLEADRDHAEPLRVSHGVFGPDFLPNVIAADGQYAHATAGIEFHPNVTGDYVQPGIGLSAYYDVASGDLNWQRVKLGLSARQYVGRVTLSAHVDAGAVFSGAPPPQTLFTLGGSEALAGYAYKAFAGDRAALVRSFASYRFPVLNRPVPFVRNYYLPALSPGIAVSLEGGWTQISSPAAQRAVEQLNGPTAAAPLATHGLVATAGGGLTLMSDIVHLGVARPVSRGGKWRAVAGFGLPF